MTDRERRLEIYSGQSIDWRNWDVYMPKFVCRCAKEAKQNGHNTFGVQYYGTKTNKLVFIGQLKKIEVNGYSEGPVCEH